MSRKAWQIAFTYVGAVVGAGFSSGQEIWHFFSRHQAGGLMGVILVGICFACLGPIFFRLGKLAGVSTYHHLFYNYLPTPLPQLCDITYGFFLLGSVAVMLAGSGTLFQQLLGVPYFLGALLTLALVLITLYLEVEGIFTVNGVLIPLLLLITILTVLVFFYQNGVEQLKPLLVSKPSDGAWVFDALLYVSYNLVLAVAVMTGIVYRESTDDIIKGSSWGGVMLFILNLLIFLGLFSAFYFSAREEIPMLYLARRGGPVIYFSYFAALYLAMASTAIANFYTFTRRLISLIRVKYALGLWIAALLVLPLVRSGFSTLIERLYPIFGYLGLYLLAYYIFLWVKLKYRK